MSYEVYCNKKKQFINENKNSNHFYVEPFQISNELNMSDVYVCGIESGIESGIQYGCNAVIANTFDIVKCERFCKYIFHLFHLYLSISKKKTY